MRRFAKNDNSAICNYCGKWQPTDLTNQQLEEMDWKCAECKAKEGTPEVEPTEQERGSKEISKYDPEYAFLVKLVKLLTSEGVSPQEIKSIADAYPFVTVDDVGDLTAKLWTLATTKYQIPREWLTKRLPKNSSLKQAAPLWQAQKETQDMINHAPGYIAYEYGQDKTSKDEFTGAEFSHTDVGVNPTLDNGPFSSPEDHGAKPQKQPFPNTNWLPADDGNKDEQPYSNVASLRHFSKKDYWTKAKCPLCGESKSTDLTPKEREKGWECTDCSEKRLDKKARMDAPAWIAPDGQIFTFGDNTHDTWGEANAEMLKTKYNLDLSKMDPNTDSTVSYMIDNGWTRASVADTAIVFNTKDISHIDQLDDYVAQNWKPNFQYILIETFNGNFQVTDPFPTLSRGIQKARKFSKKADLSGQTVNQIVNALHANGGVTWNLSQGNMVGTDNYAVSVYPERAQILDGADFDRVEEFITSNSDLLGSAENSFGAWSHDGKVYMDVVATIPDINKAVELGKQHNQIAIWDLKNGQQIPTGGTGELKQASQQSILPQQLQDEVAAKTSPVYNIALTNYAEAVKRGHEKDRSLEYAIKSVSNLEQIDSKKLVELINQYI